MPRGLGRAEGVPGRSSEEVLNRCGPLGALLALTASDKCQAEKRKTINGDDLLWAMGMLGFDKYVDPLRLYLSKYREVRGRGRLLEEQVEVAALARSPIWLRRPAVMPVRGAECQGGQAGEDAGQARPGGGGRVPDRGPQLRGSHGPGVCGMGKRGSVCRRPSSTPCPRGAQYGMMPGGMHGGGAGGGM